MDTFHCIGSLNFSLNMCFELNSYLEIGNKTVLGLAVRKTPTGPKLHHRDACTVHAEGTISHPTRNTVGWDHCKHSKNGVLHLTLIPTRKFVKNKK